MLCATVWRSWPEGNYGVLDVCSDVSGGVVCLFVWLFGCLVVCLFVCLFGCLVIWLFGCLVGCLFVGVVVGAVCYLDFCGLLTLCFC